MEELGEQIMGNRARRRAMIAGDGTMYLFRSGTARINGNVDSTSNGYTVREVNIVISTTGKLAVKADFTRFKKLYIDIGLLESSDSGVKTGYGNSASTFISYNTKTASQRETKEYNIEAVNGEKYVIVQNGGYTNSTSAYIYNIWLEG